MVRSQFLAHSQCHLCVRGKEITLTQQVGWWGKTGFYIHINGCKDSRLSATHCRSAKLFLGRWRNRGSLNFSTVGAVNTAYLNSTTRASTVVPRCHSAAIGTTTITVAVAAATTATAAAATYTIAGEALTQKKTSSCGGKAYVDHAPDMPPESVRRSSPLASQGLVAPLGLHGFLFKGGRGWGGGPSKNRGEKRKKKKEFCFVHHQDWGLRGREGGFVSMSRKGNMFG